MGNIEMLILVHVKRTVLLNWVSARMTSFEDSINQDMHDNSRLSIDNF